MNRTGQNLTGCHFQDEVTRRLLLPSWASSLAFSLEKPCCKLACGEAHSAGTDVCDQQKARTWDWAWKWVPPASSQPSRWLQPWETFSQKHPAEPRFLTHRNCEINVYCFKLLSFGVICYMAIDNILNKTFLKIVTIFNVYELGLLASSWLLIVCILSNVRWPFRFLYSWSIFRTLSLFHWFMYLFLVDL